MCCVGGLVGFFHNSIHNHESNNSVGGKVGGSGVGGDEMME
jgi:hypothetical protein